MEQNSPFYGTNVNFDPSATSSSLDEQVLKEQICMDSIELATPRTETSSSTFDGNKKEKMAPFVFPFNCGDEQQFLKYHIQLQHSEKILTRKISGSDESTAMQLLCPFECGSDPFKTQTDLDAVVRSGSLEFSDAGEIFRYYNLKLWKHNLDDAMCCHWQ